MIKTMKRKNKREYNKRERGIDKEGKKKGMIKRKGNFNKI